jgi:hypothetical protein
MKTETRRLLEELVEKLGGRIDETSPGLIGYDGVKHIYGVKDLNDILKISEIVVERQLDLAKLMGYGWVEESTEFKGWKKIKKGRKC